MVLIFLLLLAWLCYAILQELDGGKVHPPRSDEQCHGCGGIVDPEWIVCPRCRTLLHDHCAACGRTLGTYHRFCPWCGRELTWSRT